MKRLAVILSAALVLMGSSVSASVLESPASGASLSGLGFISGWKCDASAITVRIDGGTPTPVLYGNDRLDTHVSRGGPCQRRDTGYILQINWGELADGSHTAVAYDAGVEFARSVFRTSRFRDVRPLSNGMFVAVPRAGNSARRKRAEQLFEAFGLSPVEYL